MNLKRNFLTHRNHVIQITLASLGCAFLFATFNHGYAVSQESNFDLEAFRNDILSNHNKYRAIHNSPPLTLDSSLNQRAQAHAEKLAQLGRLEYSQDINNEGENLRWANNTASQIISGQGTPTAQYLLSVTPPGYFSNGGLQPLGKTATDSWYSEASNYNYETGQSVNGKVIGHFTQVVWKGTTKMGCGAAVTKNSKSQKSYGEVTLLKESRESYVVCLYAPAGNISGKYQENVLKP